MVDHLNCKAYSVPPPEVGGKYSHQESENLSSGSGSPTKQLCDLYASLILSLILHLFIEFG